ncbi:hypothetical protein GGH19_000552 [Coemansia sp. RSA 1807]|nr:hypothetical protein LPJ69_003811 [Coemansia sp. RSA 1752]KAJ1780539.1 hypothetical protein LPJ54_000059 [Coemansia sp. RSA 1824]KAJ2132311.1 hypothetical protein GGF48_001027 [Coemansia sp. RSA 921]KAJ2257434.1 hypothetical protein GGH98_000824 [Coemansia sp. RSA 454]KAJ2281636.1 hypothetical protein EV176_000337 [Coemansia sp. RSA 451]KAJ2429686.1 hypothetical protein GGF47_000574 [Coemansia sp. RSA 2524]KAJ2578364.1 hypothetical protein GGH19_000552 [Coemansia sp. RSA 1807]
MGLNIRQKIDRLDRAVAQSKIGHWFRLDGSGAKRARVGSKFTTELRGGLATFVTMSYIISTSALILTDTGGTCDCDREQFGATCDSDPAYTTCLQTIKMDMITATCAVSCITSVLMGLLANLPIALAPGMGLIAYFTYTVVGYHGTGNISYENALAAVCIEGIIFFVLSVLGIRQWFARLIPASLKTATGTGIGIYLAFIGLQSSAGIGLITANSSTLVELGGCPPEFRDENNVCTAHHMEGGPMWLGVMGLIVISILSAYKVKGSVLIGILLVSIISWPRGTSVTYFPYTQAGDESFNYFKKVVTFHPIEKTLAKFHFDASSGQFWIALITFLYVDILDCTGTLFSMAKFGGYMDERTQDFEGSSVAFLVDSMGVILSAVFGLAPVSAFLESGAGIAEGAKTGIASITTGFCFFIALFFAPIFASFPPWATGPALILVGSMMAQSVVNINWKYIGDAVPAFLVIVVIPFGYSIGYGIIAGIGSYLAINGFIWIVAKVTKDRVVPPNRQDKEVWSSFMSEEGAFGILPGWLQRTVNYFRGHQMRKPNEEQNIDGTPELISLHSRQSNLHRRMSHGSSETPEKP